MRPFMASHVSPEDFSPIWLKMLSSRETCPRVSSKWCLKADASSCEAAALRDLYSAETQKAEASGRHFRTKIVTLKDRLDVVQPAHLAESKRYSATRFTMT